MDNQVLLALTLAAVFISLINECDKENARALERKQAEAQVRRWESEGGAL